MNKNSLILIVDDEPINIKLLEKALQDSYDICTANNGYDAIRLVKEKHPDLILLDVMMPDLSGFEVCNIIKYDVAFAEIPVIFLTAMNLPEGEALGLELGGIDYLAKPVNLELLKLRVRNHLELKERNDLVREQRDLLSRQNEKLEAALARIRRLEGIIPICMYCKQIRNDQDDWTQLEQYITDHSEAMFSHGICPHCEEEQMEIINNLERTSD